MLYKDAKRIIDSDDIDDYKITLASIVFLQGDDYNQMESELNESDTPDISVWLSDDKVIEHLLQWDNGDYEFMDHSIYDAMDINTEFLGCLQDIEGQAYTYSLNTSIGYAGLSKIISLDKKG